MKNIFFLLFLIISYFINASTIKLDSLLMFINNNNVQNTLITDSISIGNIEFCKLFGVNKSLNKNSNYEFKVFYSQKDISKVFIKNTKLKIENYFFVLNFNNSKILLSCCNSFFILPKNDFYIFFKIFKNSSNGLSCKEIISVDSQFIPLTKMYLNKDMLLANSNFIYKKGRVYEDITIYLQDYGKCIQINDKSLDFIYVFFQEKGIFSCNGSFKRYTIELQEKHEEVDFFWFLGTYDQKNKLPLNLPPR
jgi:hypothetical protein